MAAVEVFIVLRTPKPVLCRICHFSGNGTAYSWSAWLANARKFLVFAKVGVGVPSVSAAFADSASCNSAVAGIKAEHDFLRECRFIKEEGNPNTRFLARYASPFFSSMRKMLDAS
jgi:hypothetical protein